ncbi:MAG: MBL fold metallo-hydrolase [Gammaproteobacteria bacterium]|nr:MBL fold metallo-hydrolase [Gammaproteobacteria bacterium]MDH4256850.1 MBL fold metallo-hydrolase [Gammaproteobacteria bacterium]MDH5311704.1 MBL fold metallo-hydrolase [Gammaproteobacteria bacterium]
MNRRTLALVLTGFCLAPLAAAQQDFSAVEIMLHDVAGNVRYLEGSGGNIGLLAGDDGVLLIDDQYAPLTDKIVAAIRKVSDQPIRFVINTHMHPDHTGGNENLGRMGAMIVGHDNVRAQMAKAGYAETPPFVTFSEDVTFHVNGETVHVFKVPEAHTNGDSFIWFENANVIHTGDVFRTTGYPYIDTGNGGSFLGTIRAWDLLIDLSASGAKIIPGHGVATDVEEVRSARAMLLDVRDKVRQAIAAGMTLEQAQGAGLTAAHDPRYKSDSRLATPEALVAAAYKDLAE